jgi:hypothetical protein
MSVAIRLKRHHSPIPSVAEEASAATSPAVHSVEAPEMGECEREAPELRRPSHAEAPDAGDGRASYLEHEFTHGRSQS